MAKVIYSMSVSLDGFIAGPDGDFGWAAPDEELHRFHNRQTAELGVHVCGRRLYEVMTYWETAEEDPAMPGYAREFAQIWKALPKVVASRTLDAVVGRATLIRDDVCEAVSGLRQQEGEDVAVGGAGLASALIERDLVDEYRMFVNPVIVGGGTPFFPALQQPLALRLVETRTFGSRVVYVRYERMRSAS